jgi:hypothetical protein
VIPVPPTLKEGTDNYRLFMALRSGEPKSHHELYALHMIVHSRASDLRLKHGCLIDTWRDGGSTMYQLRSVAGAVQTPGETAATAAVPGPPASGPSSMTSGGPSPDAAVGPTGAGPDPISPPGSAPVQKQLEIWSAAA